MGILDKIAGPDDLKRLDKVSLDRLAQEIRHLLVSTLSCTGGHLSSNLGVVELTLTLHRVFNSPWDKIIFDVGHQSYVHKILTGRTEALPTLRSMGGLSGFTKREESEHDAFGCGHSSTSVSAALGFCRSAALKGEERYTIAVVGDGAFTGGMIYEALNNISPNDRLIIILNENEMSISKNVGSVAKYLARIRTDEKYFRIKIKTSRILSRIPLIGKPLVVFLRWFKHLLRESVYKSTFFEELGLDYLGPVDGNDLTRMEAVLRQAKRRQKPVLVHVNTRKGMGYTPAEDSPDCYHSVGTFTPETGLQHTASDTFSSRFGELLTDMASSDSRICAITAAMCDGTGLVPFKEKHPSRFFDVGIAEEHAATFAAGLSCAGMVPFFAVYSTFLQRGYDQLLHDIALQKLHAVICVDRAGIVGGDGPTHQGIFDAAFLTHIPGMTVYSPATYDALNYSLRACLENDAPAAVRYPRGCEEDIIKEAFPDTITDMSVYGEGEAVIITYGRIAAQALKAVSILKERGIGCKVLLLNKIKPLDCGAVLSHIKDYKTAYMLEEGIRTGGVGQQLKDRLSLKLHIRAIDDTFPPQGEVGQILKHCVLDAESVADEITVLVHNSQFTVQNYT
ncbi:MAG: 1-deoxy-D-xylulose-5-phosphate synthase [Eubacteriales bacterium]